MIERSTDIEPLRLEPEFYGDPVTRARLAGIHLVSGVEFADDTFARQLNELLKETIATTLRTTERDFPG